MADNFFVTLQTTAVEAPPRTSRLPLRALLAFPGQAPLASLVLALGVLGLPVYFVLPSDPHSALFTVYGVGGALLIVYGALRYLKGRHRLPWFLLAMGQFGFSIGDAIQNYYPNVFGQDAPFPGPNDVAYLAGYPFLAFGIYLLVRKLESVEGLYVYVDAALITFAFALVQWVFLIGPYVDATDETAFGKAVLMLYPALDVLLVAVLARFFVTPAWRTASYALLVPAVLLLVIADEIYVADIEGYVDGQWSDALWLMSYVLFAVAALAPSMRKLSVTRSVAVVPRLSPSRLGLFAAALVTAPIVLIIEIAGGAKVENLYLAAASAVALSALALVRIIGLVRGIQLLRVAEREARLEVERARARLAEQNEQLIAADRMKDEFIGMISHDLRTPLVSATGFLELLSDGDAGELNDEQKRYVGFVQRASDRLLRQIEDMLVAASLQAGRFALDREHVELAEIAEESVEGQRAVAASKGVELLLSVEPAPRVDADPLRLAQVVDNLLSNGIKFTPKGGTVNVRVLGAGDHAVLEVSDSGIGIPDAEQAALFERFFRTSNAVERRIPGTGLGLYIVKSLVEAHGGVITLRSAAGEGTTFRVELPAAGSRPAR